MFYEVKHVEPVQKPKVEEIKVTLTVQEFLLLAMGSYRYFNGNTGPDGPRTTWEQKRDTILSDVFGVEDDSVYSKTNTLDEAAVAAAEKLGY